MIETKEYPICKWCGKTLSKEKDIGFLLLMIDKDACSNCPEMKAYEELNGSSFNPNYFAEEVLPQYPCFKCVRTVIHCKKCGSKLIHDQKKTFCPNILRRIMSRLRA